MTDPIDDREALEISAEVLRDKAAMERIAAGLRSLQDGEPGATLDDARADLAFRRVAAHGAKTVGGPVEARHPAPSRRTPMPQTVREVISRLEADGWYLSRTRGSHRQFRHPGKSGIVTVAGKLSTDVPLGTERSIFRQAGIGRSI